MTDQLSCKPAFILFVPLVLKQVVRVAARTPGVRPSVVRFRRQGVPCLAGITGQVFADKRHYGLSMLGALDLL